MSSLKRSNTMQTLKRSNTVQTIKRAGTGAWRWINAEDANISQNHPVGVSYFQRSNTYKRLQSENTLRYRQQQRPAYNTQYQSYTNDSYNNGYNNSYDNSYNYPYNNNNNSYSVNMDNRPGPSSSVKRPEPAVEKYEKENDMNKRKKNSKIPSVLYNPEVRKQLEQMKQHKPYFMYIATAMQIFMFVYSMYYNFTLTKKWVESFNVNPMIGPSAGTLINLGARFLPCMKETEYQGIICPPGMTGTLDPGNPSVCSLKDMCKFDMKDGETPNQWYRFIVPIFLHGGIVHIIFNLSFQVRTGIQMEKDFGTWRIMLIYMLSGIFGFAFEAKSNGVAPSVGCSGSLYGLMACLLLDLIQSWKLISNPWTELFKMILIIIFSLGIGLLPNIDNYAHIGGFIMGLLTGLIFLPSIIYSKRHLRIKRILMIVSIFVSIFLFIWVFRQFYYSDGYCSWCHYLNCLPIGNWCDSYNAQQLNSSTSTNNLP